MSDEFWQGIRYLLIVLGMWLVSRGKLPATIDPTLLVESIYQVIGGLMTIGSILWGFYTRWRTKAVPNDRVPVGTPVVSQLTGALK